jgi:hypothetical protein
MSDDFAFDASRLHRIGFLDEPHDHTVNTPTIMGKYTICISNDRGIVGAIFKIL